jgi:hypothetical protein
MREIACLTLVVAACAGAPLTSPAASGAEAKIVAASKKTDIAIEKGQRTLDAAALRALLSNVNVTPVQPIGVVTDHPSGEVFLSEGLYVRIIGRTRVYGSYDIRDHQVCVRGEDFERQCRQVIALANDTYSLADLSDESTMVVKITPLGGAPQSSGITVSRAIADRFPGATILGEAEFASTVVGSRFRYRVSGEIIVEHPAEGFFESGRYSVGHRPISQGKYSFKDGVVSIECTDCPDTFLGLGRKRVFFRHQGRLLMTNANGEGSVIELIPAS